MFVTEDTSQDEMSWLKATVPKNMRDMSTIEETFQLDMSPVTELPVNILRMLVVRERSGTSLAAIAMSVP